MKLNEVQAVMDKRLELGVGLDFRLTERCGYCHRQCYFL